MLRPSLLLGLLLALPTLAGTRHAYHSSITELKINPAKNQVEVAVKVFTDDFEKALSQGKPKLVSLRDPGVFPLATLYLNQHLKLTLPALPRTPRVPLEVQFMGLQAEKDAYWLYAKATLPHPTKELLVRQTMMLELYGDQMNIVNAEGGTGKKVSALLRKGHEEEFLNF